MAHACAQNGVAQQSHCVERSWLHGVQVPFSVLLACMPKDMQLHLLCCYAHPRPMCAYVKLLAVFGC